MNGIYSYPYFSKLRKQYLNLECHTKFCGRQNNETKICLFKSGDMAELMNLATFVTEIMNNFKDK